MDFWSQFKALVDGAKTLTIVALFVLDFLLGVIVAIKEKTFKLSKIGECLNTTVIYYMAGYYILGGVAVFAPSIDTALVLGAFTLYDLTMLGSIMDKLRKLGLNIPASNTLS